MNSKILALAVVVFTALALSGVASAHTVDVSGAASCEEGSYTVVWTLTNNQGSHPATVIESSRAAVPVGLTWIGTVTREETVPGSTTALALDVTVSWTDGFKREASASASGFTGCKTPPPPFCETHPDADRCNPNPPPCETDCAPPPFCETHPNAGICQHNPPPPCEGTECNELPETDTGAWYEDPTRLAAALGTIAFALFGTGFYLLRRKSTDA